MNLIDGLRSHLHPEEADRVLEVARGLIDSDREKKAGEVLIRLAESESGVSEQKAFFAACGFAGATLLALYGEDMELLAPTIVQAAKAATALLDE